MGGHVEILTSELRRYTSKDLSEMSPQEARWYVIKILGARAARGDVKADWLVYELEQGIPGVTYNQVDTVM